MLNPNKIFPYSEPWGFSLPALLRRFPALFLLAALVTATLAACGDDSPDRAALVALYEATDGPNWSRNTNWLSDSPLGEWRGVTTNSDGRVTALNLGSNRLSGPIPFELSNLSNLTDLSLGNNQLTGPIPPELGNLSNLAELTLDDNQLTGPIPPELGSLSNLRELDLRENNLRGCVPEGLQAVAKADARHLAPSPPNIRTVDRTSSTATLLVGVRQDDAQQEATYEVHRSDDGQSGTYNIVRSNMTQGAYEDQGLAADTTYYYKASGCNSCGCSGLSLAAGVITEVDGPVDVPPVPTSIAGAKINVSTGADDAGVTWQRSPGATFYQIFQDSSLDMEVSAPATEYRDYAPNTSFFSFITTTYKVRACNKAGCSQFTTTVTIR